MAGAGDIRAGKAFVEVYADKKKLDAALSRIQSQLKAFGAGVSAIGTKLMAGGAGIVTPLLAATKRFMSIGDQLDDMAARTGLSTNALSELGFAAEQSGASIEDVETSVKRMQRAIFDAATGSKEQADAFKLLGLDLASLNAMKPEDQLTAIGKAIAGIADPTQRAGAALTIFGRSGTALLPMLGDMEALRAEAVRLGLSIGPEQAKQAAALTDAWDRIKRSFGAVAVAIGSSLAPMLTGLAGRLKDGIQAVRQWMGEHKSLIVSLFAGGTAAVAFGAGLFVVGKAIAFASGALTVSLAMAKGLSGAFSMLTAAATVLANPFVLAGVAVAALGGYLLYTSGIAGQVASYLGQVFASLVSEVHETFGVIAQSLAAGDLVSAAKVGWALIKLEWQKGVAFITGLWEGFKRLYDEATTGIALTFINVSSQIQKIWADLINWLSKTWTDWGNSWFIEKVAGLLAPIAGVTKEQLAETFKADRQQAKYDAVKGDADTAKRKAQIEADRKSQEDALVSDMLRRQKSRDADVKAAQDAVTAARAEWEAAKTEARAKAAEIGTEVAKPKVPGIPMLDLAATAASTSRARGTFSASELGTMGTGGALVKRMVTALDKLVKIDEDLLKEQKRLTLECTA